MDIMDGCGTKYQMSRSPEHKHRLSSTDFSLIKWEIGWYLITFEKKHPVYYSIYIALYSECYKRPVPSNNTQDQETKICLMTKHTLITICNTVGSVDTMISI